MPKFHGYQPVIVYESAARTATPSKPIFENYGCTGLVVFIDCSEASATPSVVFTIQGYNRTSDEYWTILASAAVTGTGNTVLKVYPGLTAAANTVASDVLPFEWAIDAAHADGDSITYSVTAFPIP